MSVRSVLLLGGSFDPVHSGHVGLARYFCTLLHPDELRLIPSGRPWQKPDMVTPAVHRIAMLRAAFDGWPTPICIDEQEIRREGASYMIDTLRSLRTELGCDVSLGLIMGADQLINLHTWHAWSALFDSRWMTQLWTKRSQHKSPAGWPALNNCDRRPRVWSASQHSWRWMCHQPRYARPLQGQVTPPTCFRGQC